MRNRTQPATVTKCRPTAASETSVFEFSRPSMPKTMASAGTLIPRMVDALFAQTPEDGRGDECQKRNASK